MEYMTIFETKLQYNNGLEIPKDVCIRLGLYEGTWTLDGKILSIPYEGNLDPATNYREADFTGVLVRNREDREPWIYIPKEIRDKTFLTKGGYARVYVEKILRHTGIQAQMMHLSAGFLPAIDT